MKQAGGIDEILVDHLPGETRAALVANGRLVSLAVIRPGRESMAGAVLRGRVGIVRRDQGAAFVEIGAPKSGFLSLRRGAKPPVQGGALVVQVTKDAVEDKGPGLTDRPVLVGRLLTLRPGQPGLERSRRLDPDEFARAAKALKGVELGGDGLMVNPAAFGARDEALLGEARALKETWDEALKRSGAPKLLIPAPDPVLRAMLDHAATLKTALFDDADRLNRARAGLQRLVPELAPLPKLHPGPAPLFRRHGLETQIGAALSARVGLPGGAALAIDELASMTVIDVDMARQVFGGGNEDAALAANLEAADEIARQIALRDLGGIVVVDFLRMASGANRKRVIEALRHAALSDAQQVDVLGMTPAGLVELTRRRGRPSLKHLLGGDPLAAGFALLRAAIAAAQSQPGKKLVARAAPPVVKALEAETASLAFACARIPAGLELRADPSQSADKFDIAPG